MNFNKKSVPQDVTKILDKYKSGDKTDGWVFRFFDWYFNKYMDKSNKENRELFANDFPEIYEGIQYVGNMLK